MNLSKVFKKAVKIEDGFQFEVRRLEDAIKAKEEQSRASIYSVIDSVVKVSLYKYRRVVDSHDIDEMSLKLYDSITKAIAKAYTHNARIKDDEDIPRGMWLYLYGIVKHWADINFSKYYSKGGVYSSSEDLATKLMADITRPQVKGDNKGIPYYKTYDPEKGKKFQNWLYEKLDKLVKDDKDSVGYSHKDRKTGDYYTSSRDIISVENEASKGKGKDGDGMTSDEVFESMVGDVDNSWKSYGESDDPVEEEKDKIPAAALEQFKEMSYDEQEAFLKKWKRAHSGKKKDAGYDKLDEMFKKIHVASNNDPVSQAAIEAGATDIKKTEKDGFPCTRIEFDNPRAAKYFRCPKGYFPVTKGKKIFVYNKAEMGVADSKIKDADSVAEKEFIEAVNIPVGQTYSAKGRKEANGLFLSFEARKDEGSFTISWPTINAQAVLDQKGLTITGDCLNGSAKLAINRVIGFFTGMSYKKWWIKDITNQPFKKFIPLSSLSDNAYTALN